jgi:hypothetical protein
VLSTTSRAWASCASDASPATSTMPSSGFVGVSHQTSFVTPGRMAARTASRSDCCTVVYSMPQCRSTLSTSRKVPPYASPGSTR